MNKKEDNMSRLSLICFFIAAYAVICTGQVTFERTYGSIDDDMGYSLCRTSDGGFVISGFTTNLYTTVWEPYVIKINQNGDTLWSREPVFSTQSSAALSVIETMDLGIVVAGYYYQNSAYAGFLVKYDAQGDTLWTKTYPLSSKSEQFYCVRQTADSGFILSGTQNNNSGTTMDSYPMLVRTDKNGNFLWRKTYGTFGYHSGYGVDIASDGGFVLCGVWNPPGENEDAWLIKTNAQGTLQWDKKIGGSNSLELVFCVRRTPDNGYILCGNYFAGLVGISADLYLVKTDVNGAVLWSKRYGGSDDDRGSWAEPTPDGGFIACGSTGGFPANNKDLYLVKTNASGDTLWTQTYGGEYPEEGYAVTCTVDNGFLAAGYSRTYGYGGSDVYVVKTNEDGIVTGLPQRANMPVSIIPNPNDGLFRVGTDRRILEADITDACGKVIFTREGDVAGGTVFDIRGTGSGVFFLRLMTDSGPVTKKIIVQKN
jgi:hypothetical protein